MNFFNKKIEFKSEEDLINSAKQNSNYFSLVYKKYHEQIFRFIYQRIDSIDEASDITSQVFLKALLNLNKFEFKGFPFSSWLYKIALNEVNQYYRKTKKERTVNIDTEKVENFIEELSDENNDEKKNLLIKVLTGLNEEKLLLIEMRFFEKRSFKEIGEILNITENNAKVKTYRVLDEMKNKMLQLYKK